MIERRIAFPWNISHHFRTLCRFLFIYHSTISQSIVEVSVVSPQKSNPPIVEF